MLLLKNHYAMDFLLKNNATKPKVFIITNKYRPNMEGMNDIDNAKKKNCSH